jgi:hypothetical protein
MASFRISASASIILILVMNSILGQEAHAPQEGSLSVDLGSPFQLKVGWQGCIEEENIKIKFSNVTGDSRCPAGQQCKWEGQVGILLNVTKNGENLGNFCLINRTTSQEESSKSFDEYAIKLERVDPYPKSNQKIQISDYIATLIINKTLT